MEGGGVRAAVLGWSAVFAVLYIALASWFFTHVHRYAVRTGLLARYSAESTT